MYKYKIYFTSKPISLNVRINNALILNHKGV